MSTNPNADNVEQPTTTTNNNDNNKNPLFYVDIGANLLDDRFVRGIYHGKPRHEPDLEDVLQRAVDIGMKHMVLTAGTLQESVNAVQRVRQLRRRQEEHNKTKCQLYCTVGVHPTQCREFVETTSSSEEDHLSQLLQVAKDGMRDGVVAAVGEMGLDYDRLQFCDRETQKEYFQKQLVLAQETKLPLFLHNRNVGSDLYDVLVEHRDMWSAGGGVVHSFDDTIELARKFMDDLGLYIGLNGCSLRTAENLEVVKHLPLDSILLETDCPYCDIKRTHAGYSHVRTVFESRPEKKFQAGYSVKGRNEPRNIVQVAEVIAGVRNMPVEELVEACYKNSLRLYGWKE